MDFCTLYCDRSKWKNYSTTDIQQSGPTSWLLPLVLNALVPRALKDGHNFFASGGDKLLLIIPRFLKRGLYLSPALRDQSLNGYEELRKKHVRDVLANGERWSGVSLFSGRSLTKGLSTLFSKFFFEMFFFLCWCQVLEHTTNLLQYRCKSH